MPADALKPARIGLFKGDPGIGQAHTEEKELRPAPDTQVGRAVAAFFWSKGDP